MRDVREGTLRVRGARGQVHVLRLPLAAEPGEGDMRDAEIEREAVRKPDRGAATGALLTESNMRALVRMVNEEMDVVIAGERERLEAAELELREVRQRMDRLWQLVEKTEMTVEDILPRIRHQQENQERLERAADEARMELKARLAGVQGAEVVAAYAREMGEWLLESGLAETKAFLRTFVRQI